jgi:hypothetical protein
VFNFKIIGSERIHGKKAHVLEAIPKSENEDGIWSAKLWIEERTQAILRCIINGVPAEGYDDVLNDCAILNITPIFTITHDYEIEKSGIYFPSHSRIRVTYPAIDTRGRVEKLSINLDYGKYKFFTVETSTTITK